MLRRGLEDESKTRFGRAFQWALWTVLYGVVASWLFSLIVFLSAKVGYDVGTQDADTRLPIYFLLGFGCLVFVAWLDEWLSEGTRG